MDKPKLVAQLHAIACPLGYQHKGGLFWKTGSELTTLIDLQRSRWGRGVYVNFGVTPNAIVTRAYPLSVEYWARQMRAESADSPFRDQFAALVMDDEDLMPPEDMADEFRWLLAWIENHYGDAAVVRKDTLDQYPDSWGLLIDWARGTLREPSSYFEDAPYYRAQQGSRE